jgi:hypothetical protein
MEPYEPGLTGARLVGTAPIAVRLSITNAAPARYPTKAGRPWLGIACHFDDFWVQENRVVRFVTRARKHGE